ncbi:MAG: hypothetical protein A2W93_12840 [Bacteroidetes bacterium GWF2_43_63]|nr:MAG: hypothetical protein A2W94_06485 [Bacteroidetes bacterium GWE2_42_42]OFY54667.1 MAG: hypothetical protein A2W93_12840 [Bacteroidetes bacterium GWF2_43_63]
MKKQLFLLLFGLFSLTAFSQGPCQAGFYTTQDSTNLYLYDSSFNTDSTAINVTNWQWTLSGMGLSYTYSVQDPIQPLNTLPNGSYAVCLTIQTGTGCSSTYCDSIFVGQQSGCQANFGYYNTDSLFYFTDYSFTTGGGNIVSWNWTFNGGTPSASTQQNPVITFPSPNTTYTVALTITTDNGCSDTYQSYVYYSDSMSCIYYVDALTYPVTTIGGSDGAIDVTVHGGTPPYYFQWNNGAATEDLYGLPSGTYTANVWSSDTTCPAFTISAYIPEPYDSGNVYVDTLYAPAVDSCLNFIPDSFYISGISTTGSNATVTWIFTGGGQSATVTIDYTFTNYGAQVVVVTLNCDSSRYQSTYMSYIFIHSAVGIEEETNLPVYPNPATDVLNLPDNSQYDLIRIISSNGSVVKEFVHPENQIEINDLPAGIYYVQAVSASQIICTQLSILK